MENFKLEMDLVLNNLEAYYNNISIYSNLMQFIIDELSLKVVENFNKFDYNKEKCKDYNYFDELLYGHLYCKEGFFYRTILELSKICDTFDELEPHAGLHCITSLIIIKYIHKNIVDTLFLLITE